MLKPIETTIKDVEIIITKVTGKSLGLTDAWNAIKSFVSGIANFSPAAIFPHVGEKSTNEDEIKEEPVVVLLEPQPALTPAPEPIPEPTPLTSPASVPNPASEPEISLEELQKILDDIAKQIDSLTQEFSRLAENQKQQIKEEEENIFEEEVLGVSCININTALAEELVQIIHIGVARAQQIIELRRERLFFTVEDLIRVSGIGETTLEAILTQRLACVGPEVPPPIQTAETISTPVSTPAQSSQPQSQISLFYNKNNPADKEIKVNLNTSNLKNSTYDIKISILAISEENEQKRTLSEIYSDGDWPSSYNYLLNVFSDTSFGREFKLRIKKDRDDFRGEADIIARVRESGKKSYLEFKEKINIIEPEEKITVPEEESNGEDQEEEIPEEREDMDVDESEDGEQEEEEEAIVEEPEEIPTLQVVINEIAWMGTKADWRHEWVELYNNTDSDIDLTDWTLESSDGTPSIIFSTSTILAQDYFLLERTDDDRISDIPADLTYAGDLGNDGEKLELRDAQGVLIDKVGCVENEQEYCIDWFAGDNNTKQTMERINSTTLGIVLDNWANNNLFTRNGLDAVGDQINGTPIAENSVSKIETQISSFPFDEGFDEITLAFYGSPYVIQWTPVIPSGKTLVVDPGVVMKFDGAFSGITVNGTLRAIGTEDEKIVFTSDKDEEYGSAEGAAPGDWRQIYFSPESSKSELDNVVINYGGAYPDAMVPCNYKATAVFVEESSITLRNSIIENNRMKGIYLVDSSSVISNVHFRSHQFGCHGPDEGTGTALHISGGEPIVENSFFQNNVNGIEIWSDSESEIKDNIFEGNKKPILVMSASPILGSNQAMGNEFDGISVRGSVARTSIWSASLPYVVEDMIILEGATLILDPGTIIRLRDANSGIEIKGILEAIGAEDEKIIFTSYYDEDYGGTGEGFWKHLRFYSSGSILEDVIIKYGGMIFGDIQIKFGAITLDNEGIEIIVRDSVLEKNKYAVVIFNNSDCAPLERIITAAKLENTIFRENEYDVYPPECQF